MDAWLGRHKKRNTILVMKQLGIYGICENNIKILGGALILKMYMDKVLL
jgi:hypothetical protein